MNRNLFSLFLMVDIRKTGKFGGGKLYLEARQNHDTN